MNILRRVKEIKDTLKWANKVQVTMVAVMIFVFLTTTACAQLKETQSTNLEKESPEGYEGNIAVSTIMIIESKHEKAADQVWDKHKKWLKATHGPWGMVSYTVAKNPEFKNPLNPASTEKTGRIIYVIHEVYRDIDGLNKHYSESPNGNYVEDFLKIANAKGTTVVVLQGSPITHSLLPKDCDFPVTISKSEEGVEKFFDKKN